LTSRLRLYLEEEGFNVTGIDNSPGAIKVCRLRGYRKLKMMSIMGIRKFRLASFDTVIMMGNNFGLFGGFDKARRVLKQMYRITSADGQIIAETRDPYGTTDPLHRAYHRFNRNEAGWEASFGFGCCTTISSVNGSITC
jgi:SAM-dependent methyltransferase